MLFDFLRRTYTLWVWVAAESVKKSKSIEVSALAKRSKA
jgi:hypothetical protein